MKNNTFSFFLRKIQKNNNEVSGKITVKVTAMNNNIRLFANKLIHSVAYNIYFVLKNGSSTDVQTTGVMSNEFGVIDIEINFPISKYNFNYLVAAVLCPKAIHNQNNTLVGFKNKVINWNSVIKNILNKINIPNNSEAKDCYSCPEYVPIPEYDKLIDSLPKFKLFEQNISGLESVKISQSQFESLNIKSLTDEAEFCIKRTIKECGYVTFSRYIHNCKVLYMIGIPDQFVPQHAFFMKDLGAAYFKCFNIKKQPVIGDSGYWIIYI